MSARDNRYHGRALRRRKARRLAAQDPMSATDRKRLGDDRMVAAKAIRAAIKHVASTDGAISSEGFGFSSQDAYDTMAESVLSGFGEVSGESRRHIEAVLIRGCSSSEFWTSAAKVITSIKEDPEPDTAQDIDRIVSLIPVQPGMFPEANRIIMAEPHTQVVIGPLFASDTISFSVYPVYKSRGRGSHPVRISISELLKRGGGSSGSWTASWKRDSLLFDSDDATVQYSQDDLLNRWAGPESDRNEVEHWEVLAD